MKVIVIIIILASLGACHSGYEKAVDTVTDSTTLQVEQQQIMATIEKESAGFWNKDFEQFALCWLHDPKVRIMGWWPDGGVTVKQGWEVIGGEVKQMMADNPTPNPTVRQLRRENMNISIRNDMAWLSFDQYAGNTGDAKFDMDGRSRETRILEKHNGQWKIVYVGWLLEKGLRQNDKTD